MAPTPTYLIKFSAINRYFLRNHNLLERGENSYESRNVKFVQFDVQLMAIRGEVSASMKQKSYKISLTDEFEIEAAKCECPRSIEICHHIAAVLFAAHYEVSRTDISCTWAPKPQNLEEIQTFREKFNFPKPKRVTDGDLTMSEISELYETLCSMQPVGFRWLLRAEPQPKPTPLRNCNINLPEVNAILFSKEFYMSTDQTNFLKEKMKVSDPSIVTIAELTLGQRSNSDWYIIRKNRITASNFGKVINAINRKRFPPSVFADLSQQKDLSRIKAIQWGIEHENDGLKVLKVIIKKEIKPTGVWLSPCGALGASPDGMIDNDIVVEVKCPFKYRKVLLSEALRLDESKSYIIHYNNDNELCLNKSHPYYHQIQGQIYLTKSRFAYLCVWTPKQAVICKIHKDASWGFNLNRLKEFYFERFISHLIGNVHCV